MVADDISVLRVFTVLSNLLLGVAFSARLVFYKRDCEFLRHLSFAALIAIIVTCVVYSFVLVPIVHAEIIFSSYANFVTHFLSLVLALSNSVFFEAKGHFRLKHALVAMVFLVGYWFVFVTPLFDFYPYFFMNPTEIGLGTAILWFVGLVTAFAGIAFGLVWVDSSEKASKIFRNAFIVFLVLAGFIALIAIVFFGGLRAFVWLVSRSPTITPEQEFFALENAMDITEEGISIEPGISLYISLRGNAISFRAHNHADVLVTYHLCSHNVYHHPVYEITHDENGVWLRIADEIRTTGRGQFKNSTPRGGEIIVFVPEGVEQVFYVVEITEHDMGRFDLIPDVWRGHHNWNDLIPLYTISGQIYLNGEEYIFPRPTPQP
jgi:hypothetical protein